MKLKEDIKQGATQRGGSIPTLDNTFSSLLNDVLPYRSPLQQFRSRLALSLLKLANLPVQKKLEKMQAEGDLDWFAESIERTYLECRSSLAFFNAYSIYLAQDTQRTFFERASLLLNSIQQLIAVDAELASAFRTYRTPEPICDNLVFPSVSGYGVLLFSGQMIVLSHGNFISADKLQQWSLAARWRSEYELDKFSIGEASALARQDWHDLLEAEKANAEVVESVNLLRSADFIFCVDEDNGSQMDLLPNRFFDKAIQVVVNPESAYLVFEHAAIDGQKAVSISEAIAAKYYENALSKREFAKPTSISTQMWTSHTLELSANKIAAYRQYIDSTAAQFLRKRHCFPELNEQFFINLSSVFERTVSIDNVIQLSMALTFYRITGRVPSMYEPVSLLHLKPRRLDFISPLSAASVSFIQSLEAGDISLARKKLIEAIYCHRAKIRQSKMGEGAVSHLMALASAEFPENKQKCVKIQSMRRRIMSRLSKTISFLAHRDMMVSNGGVSPYLESFSTIIHQPDMLGVGYMIGARGLSIDLQLHGIYKDMFQPSILIHQFIQSIHDIANVLVPVQTLSTVTEKSTQGAAVVPEKKQKPHSAPVDSWLKSSQGYMSHAAHANSGRHTQKETSV